MGGSMENRREMLAGCIYRKRVALMLAYQEIFTAKGDGVKSVYERWMGDEIEMSSREGKKVMKDLMRLEIDEKQLASLQESYQRHIYKEIAGIK
jgi:hypothetical protein